MTSRPAAAQHLRDLARLRRVRDRIDREYAQPLDVEALARGVHMSAGHLSREFRLAYGESPYAYLMTRRSSVRSRRRCAVAGLLVTCEIVPRRAGATGTIVMAPIKMHGIPAEPAAGLARN